MKFINYTPFPGICHQTAVPGGGGADVVVLRQTFELREGQLELAETQTPIATTDRHYGAIGQSSLIEESDLAPYKPQCDVIIAARAYAPGYRPAPRFHAAVQIFAKPSTQPPWDRAPPRELLSRRLLISGPRYFERERSWALSEPVPIDSLPVRYEYAWGGECRINANDSAAQRVPEAARLTPAEQAGHPDQDNPPIAHTCSEHNPLGRGYVEPWFMDAKQPDRVAAPQIEWADAPLNVDAWTQQLSGTRLNLPPAGFGVVGRMWQPRRQLAGTYDDRWLREMSPNLPDDFDFSYWNGANPALQTPHLKGNEILVLTNLTAPEIPADHDAQGNRQLCIELPGHLPMGWGYTEDALTFAPLYLDTLRIEMPPDKPLTVILAWRASIPKTQGITRFEVRFVEREEQWRLEHGLMVAPGGRA